MIKLLNKKIFAFALCLVCGTAAAAPAMEEVAIWGTRVTASSVQLDEDAMAIRQADHISDLLRTVPGIDVGGAHSLNQRITIRSMDDKDLRISIDGASQNTFMYHHMGNLQIHADILQNVAIEVGNNSVINGGLGGAVRFETRQARDLLDADQHFGARLQTSAADNGAGGYSLTAYGLAGDNIDMLVYYNFVDRDDFDVGGGRILDASGTEIAGTDGRVRGLKGELDDALVKLGWDISDSQRLKLGFESYSDEGNYSYRPDMGLATDLAIASRLNIPLTYPTEFTRDTLTLNYDGQWGEQTVVKAALYRNESALWRDETGLASWRPPLATVNEGEANNNGFNLLANTEIGDRLTHSFTWGVDSIRYKTRYSTDGMFRSGEQATHQAFFIEDRIEIGNFAVIPGLRNDSSDIQSTVIDDTFSETGGALALEYRINASWLLHAGSTQLFKAPEIGEVFIGAGLFDAPNAGIKAETGSNSELALAWQGDAVAAGLTLFRTDIGDYIYDYAANPSGGLWKDNVGDMHIDGYESYVEYRDDRWQILLTLSSAESELAAAADYAALDGARIDRQQGNTISINIDYALATANLALHWEALLVSDVGNGRDLDGATFDNAKDGYNVHNISLRWTPSGELRGLTVTFGIGNLFDEFYASQSSRTGTSLHPLFQELYLFDYEPGRNIKATVAYRF